MPMTEEEKDAAYKKHLEDNQKKRKEGLCGQCQVVSAAPGRATCTDCGLRDAAKKKELRRVRLDAGMCCKCGLNPRCPLRPDKLDLSVYCFKCRGEEQVRIRRYMRKKRKMVKVTLVGGKKK